MDETTVQLKIFINENFERTVMFNSEQEQRQNHIDMYLRHARTMCMMYEATGESSYLARARQDVNNAKSILRGGFLRPLGVHFKEAA